MLVSRSGQSRRPEKLQVLPKCSSKARARAGPLPVPIDTKSAYFRLPLKMVTVISPQDKGTQIILICIYSINQFLTLYPKHRFIFVNFYTVIKFQSCREKKSVEVRAASACSLGKQDVRRDSECQERAFGMNPLSTVSSRKHSCMRIMCKSKTYWKHLLSVNTCYINAKLEFQTLLTQNQEFTKAGSKTIKA